MTRPEALCNDTPLVWSTGKGTDFWDLIQAAMKGDLPSIRSLLNKDSSLIRAAYDYRSALYFAVREDQPAAVALLLEYGANPVGFGFPSTPLQTARDRGFLQIQQLLETAIAGPAGPEPGIRMAAAIRDRDPDKVKNMLSVNPGWIGARDERTNQPIHWAVMTRQLEMIELLLSRGADINARRSDGACPVQLVNGDYHYRGWAHDFPVKPIEVLTFLRHRGAYIDICTAAYRGEIQRVNDLLAEDPSLADRVSPYITYYAGSGAPIRNAAAGGHMEIVRLLLDHGANPNLPEEGIAPRGHALHSAVCNGHMEIVRLLLEHGAYPSVEIESSADTLSAAIGRGDPQMIDLLCSYGASRPLPLLAYYGDIRTAAAVLAANPSLANDVYALECAAGQGHASFVRLLLRYQPELARRISVGVEIQGQQDFIRSKELTDYLFSQGMDPNHRNWTGITPLHTFARRGDEINAGFFLRHGADIHAIDEECLTTPLGYAVMAGKEKMVQFLLEQGADPRLPASPDWASPLAWARRRGTDEIVTLLKT